jgi:hypothetical protein
MVTITINIHLRALDGRVEIVTGEPEPPLPAKAAYAATGDGANGNPPEPPCGEDHPRYPDC